MTSTGNPTPCLDELIRHRGDMSLLDRVVDHGDTWLEARARVTERSLFLTDGVVPAWVGIEYMAQAVAALMGLRARQRGKGASVGFLVGTRKYLTEVPAFAVNSELTVRVQESLMDENGLGLFDCQLTCRQPDGASFTASGRLNIFQPDDPSENYGG
jgi:predicted hotdog family 3-hydroxylacyl-ACP dehydratase